MSTWFGRWLEDFSAWRACRKAQLHVQIPEPEPKLNVFKTFLHLNTFGRVGLIVSALFVYCLAIGGTFSANVMPYAETFFRELFHDGHFNSNALTSALGLAGSVLWLSASVFCFRMADSWLSKIIILIASIGLALVNVTNNCDTQKETQVAHYDGPKQKQARIKQFQEDMDRAKTAWDKLPEHKRVSKERLEEAKAEFKAIKASIEGECGKRGPKCEALEAKRKAQNDKVDALANDKELTDEEDRLRAAYDKAKTSRDAEGVTPEDVGEQASAFWAFFVHIHVMDKDVALALTKDAPTIHGITQELLAWGFTPVGLKIVFWLFGLCVSTKTEADRRVAEQIPDIARGAIESLAAALPDVGRAHDQAKQMEPDHSEEAVLGIVGQDMPEILKAPTTTRQRIAAAALKDDPDAEYDRKARRKVCSLENARLWHKDRTIAREGRMAWQKDLYDDFTFWCDGMNLKPIKQREFGRVLREELGIAFERAPSERYRYSGIGLRPNLRLVTAA